MQKDTETNNQQSRCKDCHTILLDPKAVKCHECSSWQNWRRNIDVSVFIIGFMLSIISLCVTTIPFIYDHIRTKKPEMNLNVLAADFDKINIMVGNTGDAPASIKEIYVQLPDDKKFFPVGKKQWGQLIKQNDATSFILEKNSDQQLPVMANKNQKVYDPKYVSQCTVYLTYKEFGIDSDTTITHNFDCYKSFCPTEEGAKDTRFY